MRKVRRLIMWLLSLPSVWCCDIFDIVCALREFAHSFLDHFVPFQCGFLGSFLFAQILGLENNIYMQTGLIMLIGLLAKTAILQTEYAVQRRKAGMSLIQAAYVAAKDRLRPILMTDASLNMLFTRSCQEFLQISTIIVNMLLTR